MFAKLLVIAGPDRGKRFEVVPAVPIVLGRSRDADARLSDPRVSPTHCKLGVRNATLFVTDMEIAWNDIVANRLKLGCERGKIAGFAGPKTPAEIDRQRDRALSRLPRWSEASNIV